MNKFIITEEEKNRIRNLYEKIGDKPTPESLNSPFGLRTKLFQKLLNKKYNINLPTNGDFDNKEYNDKLAQYIQELGEKPIYSQMGNTIVDDKNKQLISKINNDIKKYNISFTDIGTDFLNNDPVSALEFIHVFQDWLDTNKKGWANGYPNGILNKAKGYGKFGPRTKAAWLKYGQEFINAQKKYKIDTNSNSIIKTLNTAATQQETT